MQQRRPERFSDSTIVKKSKLNRTILEYHLDSLTSRNQERLFETFVVKLCQYEICPSLRMQTGPVGGGDSKADSENIPISFLTSLSFWEGIPNDKNDKWAFAISAKKDWINKVKSDIESITSTNRDYIKVFFVTNQFSKEKKRAELEDTLSKKFNIQVVILDRTWILDRVFKNNREKLAIENLVLGEGLEEEVVLGPLDVERLRDFNIINKEIEDAISKKLITYSILSDSLNAALLARGMGRSRNEVEGLFNRAIRLATQFGSPDHLYTAKYNKAWTVYFWFEDVKEFLSLYDELEVLALNTSNVYMLERQNNLWQILCTLRYSGHTFDEGVYEQKTQTLKILLTELSMNESKPSGALQAKAILVLDQLMEATGKNEQIDTYFDELTKILNESEYLIGFSYETIITIIQELGDDYSGNDKYETLINSVIQIDTKRKGETSSAKSLFRYGLQHLAADRIYKSIDYIGRALIGLYKEESKDEFVKALYYIGIAYEKSGMLWAARGSFLNAASFANSDFWLYQDINSMQSRCYTRLKWVELRLGRVGYALEWQTLDNLIKNQLAKTDEEKEEIFKETYKDFGGVLGLLLIKTNKATLNFLGKLPDTLFSLDLDFAAYGLLYLLGGKEYLTSEFFEKDTEESLNQFFSSWLNQPAQKQIAPEPDYYLGDSVTMYSKILGTEFFLTTINSSPGIELGESVLSLLESFLSTAIDLKTIGTLSRVPIKLIEVENLDCYVRLENKENYSKGVSISYKKFDANNLTKQEHQSIGDAMFDILVHFVGNVFHFADPKKDLDVLFGKEKGANRSMSFSSSLVTLGNVLGHNPKRSASKWLHEDAKCYTFKPSVSNKRLSHKTDISDSSEITESYISHTDLKTISLINEFEWDKAKWKGIAFQIDPNPLPQYPLALLLMFENEESAKNIFTQWKTEHDKTISDQLKISIVKGVNRLKPNWYTVIIGSTIPKDKTNKKGGIVYTMARLSTMTPDTPNNLDAFLKEFDKTKWFVLAPSIFNSQKWQPIPFLDFGFIVRKITIKEAWEVEINDFESAGIQNDFDPIIPSNIVDAPVLRVIEKKFGSKKRD